MTWIQKLDELQEAVYVANDKYRKSLGIGQAASNGRKILIAEGMLSAHMKSKQKEIKSLVEAVNRDRDEYCTIKNCACDLCEAIKPFNEPEEQNVKSLL